MPEPHDDPQKMMQHWLRHLSSASDLDLSKGKVIRISVSSAAPAKQGRRRKADMYLSKIGKWFAGPHAEELRGDLKEKMGHWREEGWTEKEIVRQLRWEFLYILGAAVYRLCGRLLAPIAEAVADMFKLVR